MHESHDPTRPIEQAVTCLWCEKPGAIIANSGCGWHQQCYEEYCQGLDDYIDDPAAFAEKTHFGPSKPSKPHRRNFHRL